jgi:hypothetical protein
VTVDYQFALTHKTGKFRVVVSLYASDFVAPRELRRAIPAYLIRIMLCLLATTCDAFVTNTSPAKDCGPAAAPQVWKETQLEA